MRTLISSALFAALVACSGHAKVEATATTPTQPQPVAASASVEVEAEAPPAVKEEPKSLDIQSDVIRLKPGMAIRFGTDSDKILPESNTILDEVASVMTQNDKIHIRIEGHTDSVGDKNHNQDLSAKRAAAVKAYLVGKGLTNDRLDSLGCGQGTPIADNATDDGKSQNRRVEFVIIHSKHPRGNCELYKPGEHHHHHDKDKDKDKGAGAPATTP